MRRYLLLTILLLAIGIQCYSSDFFAKQAENYYVEGIEAYKKGQYRVAIDKFYSCIDINDSIDRNGPYRGANALIWLADSYSKLGKQSIACKVFGDYSLIEPYDDLLSMEADRILCLAKEKEKKNNFSKSIELYEKSARKYKAKVGLCTQYITAVNNEAFCYFKLGYYDKAIILYKELIETIEIANGKTFSDYTRVLNNLSVVYYAKGDVQEAEALCRTIIDLRKNMNMSYSAPLNNLAILCNNTGRFKEAERLFNELLDLTQGNISFDFVGFESFFDYIGDETVQHEIALRNLSILYRNIGKDMEADSLMAESAIVETLGSMEEYALSCENRNNYAMATKLWEKSFLFNKKFMLKHWYTTSRLSIFNYKWDFFYNRFPSFCYRTILANDSIACFAYDNELFIKGLLLNADKIIKNKILESDDIVLVAQWNKLQSITDCVLKSYSQPWSRQLDLVKLKKRAEDIELKLSVETDDFVNDVENARLTYKDVQNHLGENDVAIEFVDFKDTTDVVYYGLVLRKGYKYPKLIPLFNESEVDSLVVSRQKKSALYDMDFDGGYRLYSIIWKKLEEYAPRGSNVYYSPTGVLHKFNVDALPISEAERIGDKYNMIRLSSTREICRNHNNKIDKAAIYGGIDYDLDKETMAQESAKYHNTEELYAWDARSTDIDSLYRSGVKYLPFTEKEAAEIDNLLEQRLSGVTLMKSDSANEESFKAMSGKKFNILHIATHGFFWHIEEANRTELFKSRMMGSEDTQNGYNPMQDPMQRSGLLFAGANLALKGMSDSIPHGVEDGILTAKEISNIDLRGADIAVLSACDTGGGDVSGDGVFGLQRGFKQAGVQTIVMSLWQVNDQVTKELMVQFYTNWVVKNMVKREAFNKAVKSIRDKYPEPYYWAAFVMMD